MADSGLAGFGFDPRAPMRYPFANTPWPTSTHPNHIRSPHPQGTHASANANAVKRSTSPLQTQLRSHSHGQEQAYDRLIGQQNVLPPQVPTQMPLRFDQRMPQQQHQPQQQQQQQQQQQPQQQNYAPQQFRSQSQLYEQSMHPSQTLALESQPNPADWPFPNQQSTSPPFSTLDTASAPQYDHSAYMYTSSPVGMMQEPSTFGPDVSLDNSYLALPNDVEASLPFYYQELSSSLIGFQGVSAVPDLSLANPAQPNSPTDTSLEVRSLSSSDNGWNSVEFPQQGFDGSFSDTQAIFNPSQVLHNRTFSDSSYSDIENHTQLSWGSYVNVELPQHAIGSPSTDSAGDHDFSHECLDLHEEPPIKQEKKPSPTLSTSTTAPIKIQSSKSPQRSPTRRRASPPGRRQPRKNSMKATKATIKRQSITLEGEAKKKVGRRTGPLTQDQRKQASEIRKLGACLRCKFLKKTCDKGEPCQGCLPSHARLWQVPCTRIDIKEIAYFMKDWRADYEQHVSLGFSVDNIKCFGEPERLLYITHGYGHQLPVRAREVFVHDERCFGLDWVETLHETPTEHSVNTAKLSAGVKGVSIAHLSEYLDLHINTGFESFIDQYFEGTPFVTEMLKTAYHYYLREGTAVVKKALKFLLAYNLTQHVTMVEGIPDEEGFLGKIRDRKSKFYGKTVAPVMVNFQVKMAMAKLWRELQKEILDELSGLYSSVYSKDKLKHWPTIFIVASVLLAVWEEMQFDCHYKVTDAETVQKFCNDMEATPIKVIVGLFNAISQKLPALQEWDSRKHHHALNSNWNICHALDEVREHVRLHDQYLRKRNETKFDCNDFDSLSSKFMSKLVIRASAS